MLGFEKPNIRYRPLDVDASEIVTTTNQERAKDDSIKETNDIANKLMDHLAIIQAYKERIDAIDYLINNARTLSGDLKYTTEDVAIIQSIQVIGGNDNYVDLKLFEKAIDIVIQGYGEMALIALTGAASK